MKCKVSYLDGKSVAYSEKTIFSIQVGRAKSTYKSRYTIQGDFGRAVLYYNGINIGNGYKKRLMMCGHEKDVVLAKAKS